MMEAEDKEAHTPENVHQNSLGKLEQLQIKIKNLQQLNHSYEPEFLTYLKNKELELREIEHNLDETQTIICNRIERIFDTASHAVLPSSSSAINPAYSNRADIRPYVAAIPAKHTAPTKSKASKPMEFRVGSHILGIFGVILILIAFATMAINYFHPILQGICLFLLSGSILALSEFVFKKRSKPFALILCALSVACFYISTMLNYLVLKNITGFDVLCFTLIITGGSLYLSYRYHALTIQMIALIGAFLSLYPRSPFETTVSFLLTCGILFVISLAYFILSIKQSNMLTDIFYLFINVTYACLLYADAIKNPNISNTASFVYIGLTIIMIHLTELRAMKQYSKHKSKNLLYILYHYIQFIPSILLYYLTSQSLFNYPVWFAIYTAILILFFFFYDKKDRIGILIQLGGLFILTYLRQPFISTFMIFLLYNRYLIVTKEHSLPREIDHPLSLYCLILIFFAKDIPFILFILYQTVCIFFVYKKENAFSILQRYMVFFLTYCFLLLRVLLPCLNKSNSVYAVIITEFYFILVYYLTNYVSFLRHEGLKFANTAIITFILTLQIHAPSCEILEFILLLLGCCYTLIFLTKNTYFPTTHTRHLACSFYLTYMFLCFTYFIYGNTPVMVSIGLMVIALAQVFIGTKLMDKPLRIYGLILAYIVCVKVILVDFISINLFYKTILFAVTGVIALMISYLYMKLEQHIKIDHEKKSQDISS